MLPVIVALSLCAPAPFPKTLADPVAPGKYVVIWDNTAERTVSVLLRPDGTLVARNDMGEHTGRWAYKDGVLSGNVDWRGLSPYHFSLTRTETGVWCGHEGHSKKEMWLPLRTLWRKR